MFSLLNKTAIINSLSNLLTLLLPNKGYSRNTRCALNQISMFLIHESSLYLVFLRRYSEISGSDVNTQRLSCLNRSKKRTKWRWLYLYVERYIKKSRHVHFTTVLRIDFDDNKMINKIIHCLNNSKIKFYLERIFLFLVINI